MVSDKVGWSRARAAAGAQRRLIGMARPMVVLLLALALVGVGAMTREEARAAKQLRKAERLQNRARARDSLVRDSAHLGKII